MKFFVKKLFRMLLWIFISLIIAVELGIMLVFYGPLTRLKELYVTSAMTTMNHKYLAYIFVGEKEIQEIMERNKIEESFDRTDESLISDKKSPDSIFSKDMNINAENEIPLCIYPKYNKILNIQKMDEENNINLIDISTSTYKGYIMMVENPESVAVASCSNLGGRGMTLKNILKKYNSECGINAGGFADENGKGTGGVPTGLIIENYKVLYDSGSPTYYLVGFNKNNNLILGKFTLSEIMNMNIRDAISFRPYLIINGKPLIKHGDGGWGIAPRTAIGQTRDGTVLLLVIDGRQLGSIGATLKDVQDIMLRYGAVNAANLDGGSSTTMYYNDRLVNNPCSSAGERYIPSAFIVKK